MSQSFSISAQWWLGDAARGKRTWLGAPTSGTGWQSASQPAVHNRRSGISRQVCDCVTLEDVPGTCIGRPCTTAALARRFTAPDAAVRRQGESRCSVIFARVAGLVGSVLRHPPASNSPSDLIHEAQLAGNLAEHSVQLRDDLIRWGLLLDQLNDGGELDRAASGCRGW
jgi:hypothetical protein